MSSESISTTVAPSFWKDFLYWTGALLLLAMWPGFAMLSMNRDLLDGRALSMVAGLASGLLIWAAGYAGMTRIFRSTLFLRNPAFPRLFGVAFIVRCVVAMFIVLEYYTGIACLTLLEPTDLLDAALTIRESLFGLFFCFALLYGGLVTGTILVLTGCFAGIRGLFE
jgi:hypothetical protein